MIALQDQSGAILENIVRAGGTVMAFGVLIKGMWMSWLDHRRKVKGVADSPEIRLVRQVIDGHQSRLGSIESLLSKIYERLTK